MNEAYKDWLDQGRPTVKAVATAGLLTIIGVGIYEGVKWTIALAAAPEPVDSA